MKPSSPKPYDPQPLQGPVNDEEGEDVPELDRLDNTENALQIQDSEGFGPRVLRFRVSGFRVYGIGVKV